MTEKSVYFYDYGGDSAMTRANRSVYENAKPMLDGITAFIREKGVKPPFFVRISTFICARSARIAGRGVPRSPLTAQSSRASQTA